MRSRRYSSSEDVDVKNTSGIMNKVSVCINAIVVLLIIVIVFMLFSSIMALKGKSVFGYRSYIVLTGSMSPAFNAGSYIIVKNKSPKNIKAGDIISFYVGEEKTVLTHRVVECSDNNGSLSFITRGDANNTNDESPVAAEQVIGTVVLPIEKLGSFLLTLRKPLWLALYAVIIIALFFLPDIWGRVRYGKANRREKAIANEYHESEVSGL